MFPTLSNKNASPSSASSSAFAPPRAQPQTRRLGYWRKKGDPTDETNKPVVLRTKPREEMWQTMSISVGLELVSWRNGVDLVNEEASFLCCAAITTGIARAMTELTGGQVLVHDGDVRIKEFPLSFEEGGTSRMKRTEVSFSIR